MSKTKLTIQKKKRIRSSQSSRWKIPGFYILGLVYALALNPIYYCSYYQLSVSWEELGIKTDFFSSAWMLTLETVVWLKTMSQTFFFSLYQELSGSTSICWGKQRDAAESSVSWDFILFHFCFLAQCTNRNMMYHNTSELENLCTSSFIHPKIKFSGFLCKSMV